MPSIPRGPICLVFHVRTCILCVLGGVGEMDCEKKLTLLGEPYYTILVGVEPIELVRFRNMRPPLFLLARCEKIPSLVGGGSRQTMLVQYVLR